MSGNSFSERMAQGKIVAASQRYKGKHNGTVAKGWNVQRPKLVGLDALECYLNQFRKDVHYNAYLAVEYALFGHEWEGIEL